MAASTPVFRRVVKETGGEPARRGGSTVRYAGAERVIAIDRLPERLSIAERHAGAEPLEDGPRGYRMFKHKPGGCVRAVFRPAS